jgi:hypothetical protein
MARLDAVARKEKRKRSDATRLLIESALVAYDLLGAPLQDMGSRLATVIERGLKSRTASDRAPRGESHE